MSIKIAISSYSFYGFDPDSPLGNGLPDVHAMVDACVDYGVDGIEFLNEHLSASGVDTPQKLGELQQYAAIRGIRPVTLAASNNPLLTTPEERATDQARLHLHIDWAEAMGAPFVRVLGGRWHTIHDFGELTANRGEEPPAEGFTDDEGLAWTTESLKAAAAYAGERGKTLVLENHWGPTGTAAGAKRIHDAVGSPWLKYVLDTGNFFHLEDQYAEMSVFLDDLAMLHTKVYLGGGRLVEPEIDYARVRELLDGAGYTGYVSIEFEGKAPAREGIADGIETMRTYLVGS